MAAFAARYAGALADVTASAHLDPTLVESQLKDFSAAWEQSADLREVFLDPTFPFEQKIAILDKLSARMGLVAQVRNFLAVLVEHDRIKAFPVIVREFSHVLNERRRIVEVELTTARMLGDGEREALVEKIGSAVGRQVSAAWHVDASLVGGVIARIGSTVYDGSLRGRLDRLKEELVAG